MEYKVIHDPSFSVLVFNLEKGEKIIAEKGAMMYMSDKLKVTTAGRKGGRWRGVQTSVLGNEAYFVNTYHAEDGDEEVGFIGPSFGDIHCIDVDESPVILQKGSYLANTDGVLLDTKWQGLKGYLSERNLVMLLAKGTGTIWVNAFGGIIEKRLADGENLKVDTGYLVGWDESMEYVIERIGGLKTTILSGEGIITKLTGPGRVFMQTRRYGMLIRSLRRSLGKKVA